MDIIEGNQLLFSSQSQVRGRVIIKYNGPRGGQQRLRNPLRMPVRANRSFKWPVRCLVV